MGPVCAPGHTHPAVALLASMHRRLIAHHADGTTMRLPFSVDWDRAIVRAPLAGRGALFLGRSSPGKRRGYLPLPSHCSRYCVLHNPTTLLQFTFLFLQMPSRAIDAWLGLP